MLLTRRQGLALLGAATLPAWAARPGAAHPNAVIRLPPMRLRQRRLANGLQVVSSAEATGGGSVSVQVWYRVGGKDDPVGRTGFAHLF